MNASTESIDSVLSDLMSSYALSESDESDEDTESESDPNEPQVKLSDLLDPVILSVMDGASGQSTMSIKAKHVLSNRVQLYLQGDTSKESAANDGTPNQMIKRYIRRACVRYLILYIFNFAPGQSAVLRRKLSSNCQNRSDSGILQKRFFLSPIRVQKL